MKEEIFPLSSKFQKWFIVTFSREWHICEVNLGSVSPIIQKYKVKIWFLMRQFLSLQQELIKIGNFLLYTSNIPITSRIGVWVSAFFVMLCDGKLGGEWYVMKGCLVTVKKNHKAFFCTIVKWSGFH